LVNNADWFGTFFWDFSQSEKLSETKVGNIWFLSPLVLSKWEDLAFSVSILFEKSVFILQFLNDKMHTYVKKNITKNFIIKELKNKHTFLKTEKTKFSRRENLASSVLRKVCLFFNFWIIKCTNALNKTYLCILSFKIKKGNTLSSKTIQTEKAKSSHFDRTRGYKNQIFPT
jgi:hypothetical protein